MVRFGKRKQQSKLIEPGPQKVSLLKQPALYKGLLLLVTCLIIASLISPRIPSTVPSYQVGDVSDQNIKALQDLLVEDTASTAAKRQEKEGKSPSIYDFDSEASEEVHNRVAATFKHLRTILEDSSQDLSFDEKKALFLENLEIDITDKHFKSFATNRFGPNVVGFITSLTDGPLGEKIVVDRAVLPSDKTKGITLRNVQTQQETTITDFSSIRDLEEVYKIGIRWSFLKPLLIDMLVVPERFKAQEE